MKKTYIGVLPGELELTTSDPQPKEVSNMTQAIEERSEMKLKERGALVAKRQSSITFELLKQHAEGDSSNDPCLDQFIISSSSSCLAFFKSLKALLCLITAIAYSYSTALKPHEESWVFLRSAEAFFFLDIIVNFLTERSVSRNFTGLEHMAKMRLFVTVERDPSRLVKIYLRGDFMWDMIPLLPVDFVLNMEKPINQVVFVVFKLIRLRCVLPFLYRPPRRCCRGYDRFVSQLSYTARTSLKLSLTFLRLFIAVASASTIAGMIFIIMSSGMLEDNMDSSKHADEEGGTAVALFQNMATSQSDDLQSERYEAFIALMHFGMSTFTTVGLGSIVPSNSGERLVSILMLGIAALVSTLILSKMISAWQQTQLAIHDSREHQSLKQFFGLLQFYNGGQRHFMSKQLRTYFEYYNFAKLARSDVGLHSRDDQVQILSLKAQFTHSKPLGALITHLDGMLSGHLSASLATMMEPLQFTDGEVIYTNFEAVDLLLFPYRGSLQVGYSGDSNLGGSIRDFDSSCSPISRQVTQKTKQSLWSTLSSFKKPADSTNSSSPSAFPVSLQAGQAYGLFEATVEQSSKYIVKARGQLDGSGCHVYFIRNLAWARLLQKLSEPDRVLALRRWIIYKYCTDIHLPVQRHQEAMFIKEQLRLTESHRTHKLKMKSMKTIRIREENEYRRVRSSHVNDSSVEPLHGGGNHSELLSERDISKSYLIRNTPTGKKTQIFNDSIELMNRKLHGQQQSELRSAHHLLDFPEESQIQASAVSMSRTPMSKTGDISELKEPLHPVDKENRRAVDQLQWAKVIKDSFLTKLIELHFQNDYDQHTASKKSPSTYAEKQLAGVAMRIRTIETSVMGALETIDRLSSENQALRTEVDTLQEEVGEHQEKMALVTDLRVSLQKALNQRLRARNKWSLTRIVSALMRIEGEVSPSLLAEEDSLKGEDLKQPERAQSHDPLADIQHRLSQIEEKLELSESFRNKTPGELSSHKLVYELRRSLNSPAPFIKTSTPRLAPVSAGRRKRAMSFKPRIDLLPHEETKEEDEEDSSGQLSSIQPGSAPPKACSLKLSSQVQSSPAMEVSHPREKEPSSKRLSQLLQSSSGMEVSNSSKVPVPQTANDAQPATLQSAYQESSMELPYREEEEKSIVMTPAERGEEGEDQGDSALRDQYCPSNQQDNVEIASRINFNPEASESEIYIESIEKSESDSSCPDHLNYGDPFVSAVGQDFQKRIKEEEATANLPSELERVIQDVIGDSGVQAKSPKPEQYRRRIFNLEKRQQEGELNLGAPGIQHRPRSAQRSTFNLKSVKKKFTQISGQK